VEQLMLSAVAIYGACLSTILALAKIIPEWPVVTLVPPDSPDAPGVSLSVVNPAKRSLFIEGNWQFPQAAPAFHLRERRTLNRREEITRAYEERMGPPQITPRLFVPAQGEAFLSVTGMDEEAERLIVLWWHRNWLVPLRLPVFVRVSSSLASVVNRK
jgi:hypothetical protein